MYKYIYLQVKVDIYLARIKANYFSFARNFMRERGLQMKMRGRIIFSWGVKRDIFRRCKVERSQQAAGCVGDYKYILKSPNLRFAGRRSGVIRINIVA